MYTKAKKTISHVTPQRPMTDEEKQARIMQFLQQRRENFSLTILNGLCTNMGKDATNEHAMMMVDLAVDMADKLMEKLYPIKEEEKPNEETPAEKERKRMKGNLMEEVCASDVCAYRGKNVCTILRDEYCPMFKPKEEESK